MLRLMLIGSYVLITGGMGIGEVHLVGDIPISAWWDGSTAGKKNVEKAIPIQPIKASFYNQQFNRRRILWARDYRPEVALIKVCADMCYVCITKQLAVQGPPFPFLRRHFSRRHIQPTVLTYAGYRKVPVL